MREPPKPYDELTTVELADWVDRLTDAADTSRLEINLALAEVNSRLARPGSRDAGLLYDLQYALHEWLQRDGARRMGWPRRRDDRPPRSCGACMCSIGRLEPRAQSGD